MRWTMLAGTAIFVALIETQTAYASVPPGSLAKNAAAGIAAYSLILGLFLAFDALESDVGSNTS